MKISSVFLGNHKMRKWIKFNLNDKAAKFDVLKALYSGSHIGIKNDFKLNPEAQVKESDLSKPESKDGN